MIVDDHAQVRRGLSIFLDLWDDLVFAGEAENGQQAVELIEAFQPDVVLMDLVMPVMNGVAATRIIRKKFPHVQVVVLTSAFDLDLVTQAMEAGAKNYMFKNVTVDTMAQTIRSAVL